MAAMVIPVFPGGGGDVDSFVNGGIGRRRFATAHKGPGGSGCK